MSNIPTTPVVQMLVLDQVVVAESFDTSTGAPYAFSSTNGGSASWAPSTSVPYYGAKSLKSGTLTNGQVSDLNITPPAGCTKMRLWSKLDGGSTDTFRVYVSGAIVMERTATADWEQTTWDVSSNTAVILRYSRNAAGGANAAYVDQIEFLKDEWVDITSDVRLGDADSGGDIHIKRGRANESPIAETTECDVVINNSSGKYTELNPSSPYYGRLGRNQPFRVAISQRHEDFSHNETNTWGHMPNWVDSEGRTVTGDTWNLVGTAANFDISSGVGTIVADATNSQIAYSGTYADVEVVARMKVSDRTSEFGLMLRTNGTLTDHLRAYVTPDTNDHLRIGRITSLAGWGFGVTMPFNVVADTWYWMKAQVSGRRYRIRFWKDGTAEPTTWMFSYSDDRVAEVDGALPTTGGAGVWCRSGGATVSYADLTISVWRAHTEVVSFPSKYDLSGQDRWVPMQTRGLTRRLGQGRKDLESAVTHHLRQFAGLSAMWHPLEQEEGTVGSNAIPTGHAAVMSGVTAETPEITGTKALPGVSGLIHLDQNTSFFTGTAIDYVSTARAWTTIAFFQIDSQLASDQTLFTYTSTGTARTWKVTLRADNAVQMDVLASDGSVLDTSSAGLYGQPEFPQGCWVAAELYVFDSGGTVSWAWNWHRPEPGTLFWTINGTFSGEAGLFRSITHKSNSAWVTAGGLRLAQVMHYAGDLPFVTYSFSDAACAYKTELNTNRFSRLLTDLGVRYSVIANAGHQMGPQLPNKPLDLLRECAEVGGFILEEDRDELALILRGRALSYNGPAFELDVGSGHVSDPLDPAPDDQATRNDVTVNRTNGGFARSVQESGALNVNNPEDDPDGVGVYDESPTFNYYADTQLPAAADWRRSLGTQKVPRYPSIRLDLAASAYQASAALTARALAIDSGTTFSIKNTGVSPDSLPQLAQSYEETIGQYDHELTVVSTPAAPYKVGVCAYTTRVQPAGIVLASAFTVGVDTTLTCRTINDSYRLWVTTAADADVAEFDIMVGGARLHVNSVTGAGPTQSLDVDIAPINAVATGLVIPAGQRITLADPWRVAW